MKLLSFTSSSARSPREHAVGILSISLVLTSSFAITPTVPAMARDMPEFSRSWIEFLPAASCLAVMTMVLFSSSIAERIGKRTTVLLGLFLTALCGVAPAVLTNYWLILAARFGLGIGCGLFNSLAISLISEYFSGATKARLIGWRNAMEALGQASLTFIASWLLLFSWHLSYLVYLTALPVAVIFYVWAPREPSSHSKLSAVESSPASSMQHSHTSSREASAQPSSVQAMIHLPARMHIYAIFMLITTLATTGIQVRFPNLVVENHLASASAAGNVLSLMMACGLAAGIFFGWIHSRLGRHTLALALTVSLLATAALYASTHFWVLAFFVIAQGGAQTTICAYVFNLMTENVTAREQRLASSLVIAGCNLGGFAASSVLAFLGGILPGNPLSSPFVVLCAIYACFLVAFCLKLTPSHHEKK